MIETLIALAVAAGLTGYLVARGRARATEGKYVRNPVVSYSLVLKALQEAEAKAAEAFSLRHDAMATCILCCFRWGSITTKSLTQWNHSKQPAVDAQGKVTHVFTNFTLRQEQAEASMNREVQVEFFAKESDAWR